MLESGLSENLYQGEHYDHYLSRPIQNWIEQHYYAKVDSAARLEQLLYDPTFITKPLGHSSLFADHGIVHARDVASNILQVIDWANGVLFPARHQSRLEFMKAYGVQLSFIHDIGLYDLSDFGRKLHPYMVTQKALSPEFDDLIQTIWDENSGNIPSILSGLPSLKTEPHLVLRELLALAVCHSKSAMAVQFLCDPLALRKVMQCCAVIDLRDLYARMLDSRLRDKAPAGDEQTACLLGQNGLGASPSSERMELMCQYYKDISDESFRWLVEEEPLVRQLAEDVSDTLRSLRCADALRQRGTTLKTSGSYEIFVDRKTGNAIFALRKKDQDLLLVEIPDPISAGEANLASCELTQDGDLRASFHRGSFSNSETVQRVASNAALVLTDIYRDVIESFQRRPPSSGFQKEWRKDGHEMQILLETVSDNPEFASLVQGYFQQSNPSIQNPVRVVPSLKDVSERERRFYLGAQELDWDDKTRRRVLDRIARSGHKTGPIDPHLAFQDVKKLKIGAGSILIDAGAQPGFVYIPLTGSLQIRPLGGYPPFSIRAWMPLGITAVIRGSVRNATVVAEEDMEVLMIPQEIYLKYWHYTYNLGEFINWMAEERARLAGESTIDSPSEIFP